MSIFEDENLPGVITEIESDYSLGYDTSSFGTTNSVVIIGTAFNGPVGKPVEVYSPEHAAYIFGNTYDSARRKEVTLVAGIKDAWDRGCRTIYGCRISGKDIVKDFELNIDTPLKLRISSRFPSNVAKNCFIKYDSTVGAESITLYKPAVRATIAEKKRGEVESVNAVMKTELKLASDNGYSRDTNLVDIIRFFNNQANNNVLKLSIVNAEGVDVTDSEEAYALPLGVLYPGVYFIGHDQNVAKFPEITESALKVVGSGVVAPYSDFDKAYFRKLEVNTNVASDLPIYFDSAHKTAFKEALKSVGIVMVKNWDFLETAGVPEKAFALDDVDYEEVNLSTFEIYKRLGMGFTTTAHAVSRGEGNTPRVVETPVSDPNHIVPVVDGIYAALQNAEIDYRVLTNVYADEEISSKLPRAKDFKQASAECLPVLSQNIELTPVLSADDLSMAKKYVVSFVPTSDVIFENEEMAKIKTDDVYEIVDQIDSSVYADVQAVKAAIKQRVNPLVLPAGTTFLIKDGELSTTYTFVRISSKGEVTTLTGESYKGKKLICGDKIYVGAEQVDKTVKFVVDDSVEENSYVLGEALDNVFVFQVAADKTLIPVGDLSTVLGEVGDEDQPAIRVYATSLPFSQNKVVIQSNMFDNITFKEMVDAINANPVLSKVFAAELTEDGSENKDEMVADIVTALATESVVATLNADRTIGYNYSLYIPYRTTDNFARQLAQHCTQTEFYTHPTHGFIGCKRQTDTSLTAVAKRANVLKRTDFDLYARTMVGARMNDRNGMPYPIGKNVSVVFSSTYVNMDNENYTYLSSGAPSYAGMVSILPLDQAPTCQSVGIDQLGFTLTNSQMSGLTGAGIVTFRQSFSKGIVVTDAVTMAPADSAFRRLSAARTVYSIEDLIRICAEPYIGKPNNEVNRNSLQTAISSKLSELIGQLIESFTLSLNTDMNANQLDYVDIDYSLRLISEIREVRNTINVRNNAE